MSDERRDPGREHFEDLKEAYALGALSETEGQEVEEYLRAYPELRAEVEELKAVANLLALSPQGYEPSPELRRDLMQRVSSSPNATPTGPPPLQAGGPFWRLFGPGGIAAVAVLALVAVGMFAWNASLQERTQALHDELEGRPITYALQGTGAAREARGEVIRLGDERAVLVADDLPSPPEGKTYEAWIVRDDAPEPAGLFEPNQGVSAAVLIERPIKDAGLFESAGLFEPNQAGSAAVLIERSIKDADAVAVTVEPSGGSSSPTDDVIMTADV